MLANAGINCRFGAERRDHEMRAALATSAHIPHRAVRLCVRDAVSAYLASIAVTSTSIAILGHAN